MACGVSPTWPSTAIPARDTAFAAATRGDPPPSSLTASMPPSFRNRTAELTAYTTPIGGHQSDLLNYSSRGWE
eukprot:469768-Prorocentrum_minimum.AAC.2